MQQGGINTLISNMPEMVLSNLMASCSEKSPVKTVVSKVEPKKFEEFDKSWQKGGNILKIQVCCDDPENSSMLVYSKDREICFHANSKQLDGPHVVSLIQKKGVKGVTGSINKKGAPGVAATRGLKGYFLAFVEKYEEIVIITDPMLPAQPW